MLETLDVKFSGLVGQLYSTDVVSAVERDDITAEQTSFRANEKLLSVLNRKSPQQFQLFLDALDNCGLQHVRNVISHRTGLVYRRYRVVKKILVFRLLEHWQIVSNVTEVKSAEFGLVLLYMFQTNLFIKNCN